MEVMAVTVVTVDMSMGMGMVVVTMDMVTMVITKCLFLPSIESLKIVQEHFLLQTVFGTSIYVLTHSHNKAMHEFNE
jgi:hypothetical protein